MKLQLIRNATLYLEYAGVSFLFDPMFSDMGAKPPVINTTNDRRNPLVPLPVPIGEVSAPDAVIVTHLHPDHWDDAAITALDKSVPVFCQPGDDAAIASAGFDSVSAIDTTLEYKGITIRRTSGRHGTGEIGEKMGHVSGYVLQAAGEPVVYIAGDTIWCEDVKEALDAYRPDVTVVNAGGARFAVGDPIIMDADDVVSLCRYAAYTRVVAVHMEAINHCLVTRQDLRSRLAVEELLDRVIIPQDGGWV
ncbi:MBL fold metallo-hydrolase [Paenibacillus sepulcri]|uniref:MBL fold metallo-hydrolase n=1 Tax=Paenibacillus sepulcri TaxID=359917 RepID=A0ABS7C4F3_9BACL|nr:MBL fold metallo-hydrolase [Paenibacillus sepulcri]